MRILFCNDSFPGNFEALAGLMAADPTNEVLFLSSFFRKDFSIPGVSRVRLRLNRDRSLPEKENDAFFQTWEKAYRVGRQTFHTLMHVRESGFVPDMILVSSADGPGFFLRRAFPESFIVSYFDRSRRIPQSQEERDRLAASIGLQSYQIGQSNLVFVASEFQRTLLPSLLRHTAQVMPQFVDTEMFSPQAPAEGMLAAFLGSHPDAGLISFSIKERDENSFERIFPMVDEVLAARPHCLVSLCFGYDKVKVHWEQRLQKLPAGTRNRLFFMRFSSLTEYRSFLCAASVHVFFDVENPPSHDLLECMSCGALVAVPSVSMNSDFLHGGENCLELPESSASAQARVICHALDSRGLRASIGRKARETVMARFSQDIVLPKHIAQLKKEYENFQRKGNVRYQGETPAE